MLDDGYSAENWFQTGMRSGSPWVGREGEFLKEKVHIVDFKSLWWNYKRSPVK